MVGGVAQWLERRERTGKLPWSKHDLWLTCDHFVSKVSAMDQPTNQAFLPIGVSKWVVIHVITWIMEVDCACGCLAVRLARVCGLSLQTIGCTSALACDVQRYCTCSCRLWRYISVIPLPFIFYMIKLDKSWPRVDWLTDRGLTALSAQLCIIVPSIQVCCSLKSEINEKVDNVMCWKCIQ